MTIRRLVGIDLGIASAHTVRVLHEHGSTIAKRKAVPTLESLGEVEAAALAGTPAGTRLEVVMEPTGPAWLPISVFFSNRGHDVFRVSSAKASDLCKFLSHHTKTNGTPWPDCRCSMLLGSSRCRYPAPNAPRWTGGCGSVTGSPRRPRGARSGSRTWSASSSR